MQRTWRWLQICQTKMSLSRCWLSQGMNGSWAYGIPSPLYWCHLFLKEQQSSEPVMGVCRIDRWDSAINQGELWVQETFRLHAHGGHYDNSDADDKMRNVKLKLDVTRGFKMPREASVSGHKGIDFRGASWMTTPNWIWQVCTTRIRKSEVCLMHTGVVLSTSLFDG